MRSPICARRHADGPSREHRRWSATLVINVFVVRYESRAGRRLRSEVLGADAKHTRSDVWTTIAVLGGADRALARVSACSIRSPALSSRSSSATRAGRLRSEASGVLADEIVLAEEAIRSVVAIGARRDRLRKDSDARPGGQCVRRSAPVDRRPHPARRSPCDSRTSSKIG